MRLKSNLNGFTLAMIFALAAAMLLGTAVMNAETADDPAKQIERKLSKLKRDMQDRLAQMPEVLRKSRSLLAGDLEKELDRVLVYLNKVTGWKDDTSKTPNIVMRRDMEPLYKALERYAGTVDESDPRLATLKEKTDWKEEEILEWTDTTKTTVRYRITKSMTTQAAAKDDYQGISAQCASGQ